MKNIDPKNPPRNPRPSRDIQFRPIVDRILANPELGLCCLQAEGVELLIEASKLTDMPKEWLEGKRAMDRDCVETIVLLLRNALEAVEAELNPTPPLQVVNGGGTCATR